VEILIGLVIVIALLLLLGVEASLIIMGVLALMGLVIAATLAFFIYTALTMIGSRRVKGNFKRFEKPEKGFSRAVYMTDEGELKNSFPNEMILKKRLYVPEKTVSLLVTHKGRAYDSYSRITVYVGLLLGTASVAMLVWILRYYFSMIWR